jgi:hypothetical protein
MKTVSIFFTSLIILSTSCKKKESIVSIEITDSLNWGKPNVDTSDYRDILEGNYAGIFVYKHLNDTSFLFEYDTSVVTLTITKAVTDSFIDLTFNPQLIENCSFRYQNNQFWSTISYRPPSLILRNDSLLYYRMPMMGPFFLYCYTKKI